MYLKTLKLEKDALKDYRQEEQDFREAHRRRSWNQSLNFNLYSVHSSNNSFDEEFEGGAGREVEFNENQQAFDGVASIRNRKRNN